MYEELYINNLTQEQVGVKYGYAERTVWRNAKKMGVSRDQIHSQLCVSNLQHDIIVGNLLGDGHPEQLNCGSVSIHVRHAKDQEEYCQWTLNRLSEFCNHKEIKEQEVDKGMSQNTVYFRTKFLPQFNKYKNMTIKYQIDELNINSLIIWTMDDGNLRKKYNAYSISAVRFTKEELNYCMKSIKTKFGLDTIVLNNIKKPNGHAGIRFNREESRKLFTLFKTSDFYKDLLEVIPYKLDFEY